MALNKLTVEEMNQVSDPLVAVGNPARAAIEMIPLLAALLPQLQAAHAGIFALRAPLEDPKAREMSGRLAALDIEHDTRVRAIHGALTGLAQVSGAGTEWWCQRPGAMVVRENLWHQTAMRIQPHVSQIGVERGPTVHTLNERMLAEAASGQTKVFAGPLPPLVGQVGGSQCSISARPMPRRRAWSSTCAIDPPHVEGARFRVGQVDAGHAGRREHGEALGQSDAALLAQHGQPAQLVAATRIGRNVTSPSPRLARSATANRT